MPVFSEHDVDSKAKIRAAGARGPPGGDAAAGRRGHGGAARRGRAGADDGGRDRAPGGRAAADRLQELSRRLRPVRGLPGALPGAEPTARPRRRFRDRRSWRTRGGRAERALFLVPAQRAYVANVRRDCDSLPALDRLLAETGDARSAELATALAGTFDVRGKQRVRVRAAVALALDFWAWRRLAHEGLADDAAARLMADAVRAAAATA